MNYALQKTTNALQIVKFKPLIHTLVYGTKYVAAVSLSFKYQGLVKPLKSKDEL